MYVDYFADNYALPHTTMRRIQLPAPRRIAVPQTHTYWVWHLCLYYVVNNWRHPTLDHHHTDTNKHDGGSFGNNTC